MLFGSMPDWGSWGEEDSGGVEGAKTSPPGGPTAGGVDVVMFCSGGVPGLAEVMTGEGFIISLASSLANSSFNPGFGSDLSG